MFRVASTAKAPCVREALRDATREVHERLHRHPDFALLIDGTLTLVRYRSLLARLYGFHRPFEEMLFGVPRPWWLELNPKPRRRAYRLAKDLTALGLSPVEIASLPQAAPAAITHPAALLGCLYVREGATLGGRVLARKLEPLCGSAGVGCSFFAGTPEDGALWAELCTRLGRVGAVDISTMLNAACASYAALEAWLDSHQLFHEKGNLP